MPNLLVAPSQDGKAANTEADELYKDYETGYYEDGAYAALPDFSSTPEAPEFGEGDSEDIDPQEAYYASLNDRFRELREILHSPPPAPTPGTSQKDHASASAQASFLCNATHREWRYQILHTTPSMRLLASMHQDGVVRGLSRLETLLPKKDLLVEIQGNRLGAWCWGLLGRCREIGEMGSEEVGVLRMLGKTALRTGRKMRIQKRERHVVDRPTEASEEDEDEDEEDLDEVTHREGNPDEEELEEGQVEEEIEEGEVEEEDTIALDLLNEPNGTTDEGKRGPLTNSCRPDLDEPVTSPGAGVLIEDPRPGVPDQDQKTTDLLALAKESLLARVRSPTPSAVQQDDCSRLGDNSDGILDLEGRAFATLDMIVTIVGEFYGQKDLLDAREVWNA